MNPNSINMASGTNWEQKILQQKLQYAMRSDRANQ